MRYIDKPKYFDAAVMDQNINGEPLLIDCCLGLSAQLSWTGAGADGSLVLQYSNDGETWVTGDTQVVSGPGTKDWNVTDLFWKYARVVFAFSSGTGVLTGKLFAKGG